ncbi:hypothetical protein Fmac_016134 [Flemingia macrophylla]|uniref:Uncharacterized protein n=1 Tax=Flemingia macrophylla TaxID=520843 RepID=A0ABD1MGP4_9FABA
MRLGVPMINDRAKLSDFQHVVDRVNGRLASWRGRLLNKAGKLCLIKSTLSSIPVYGIQSLWFPQGIFVK